MTPSEFAKRLLRRLGWELRRVSAEELPRLVDCRCGSERFPLWIANRHTLEWWGRGEIRFDAELRFLRSACRPGGTVLEVGAHHGMHAVQMARWVAPGGSVHAFEINAENALVLAANAGISRLSNLYVVHAAVAEEEGSREVTGERVAKEGRRVKAVSLDSYCGHTGLQSIDVLKVDVEGFEGSVLRGARSVLDTVRSIDLELHLDDLARYGDSAESIWSLLPLERCNVEAMQRPDWQSARRVARFADLPQSGVVNLFLQARESC